MMPAVAGARLMTALARAGRSLARALAAVGRVLAMTAWVIVWIGTALAMFAGYWIQEVGRTVVSGVISHCGMTAFRSGVRPHE